MTGGQHNTNICTFQTQNNKHIVPINMLSMAQYFAKTKNMKSWKYVHYWFNNCHSVIKPRKLYMHSILAPCRILFGVPPRNPGTRAAKPDFACVVPTIKALYFQSLMGLFLITPSSSFVFFNICCFLCPDVIPSSLCRLVCFTAMCTRTGGHTFLFRCFYDLVSFFAYCFTNDCLLRWCLTSSASTTWAQELVRGIAGAGTFSYQFYSSYGAWQPIKLQRCTLTINARARNCYHVQGNWKELSIKLLSFSFYIVRCEDSSRCVSGRLRVLAYQVQRWRVGRTLLIQSSASSPTWGDDKTWSVLAMWCLRMLRLFCYVYHWMPRLLILFFFCCICCSCACFSLSLLPSLPFLFFFVAILFFRVSHL